MLKKITSAVTISALAALSLVSIASASLGDSFDITGTGHANKVAGAEYANFTIANGDPNEEGNTGQAKVQAALVVENPMLNIGAGDDSDKPSYSFNSADYANFTIANGDPNEEGKTTPVKVQFSPTNDDDQDDRPTPSGEKLNIGASDPAEQ
ncbi:MAG: hypothetical protein IH867_06240 [Chloroflexi bacterium]|nr:hypothetical protein [Chloroflexota bacterium]